VYHAGHVRHLRPPYVRQDDVDQEQGERLLVPAQEADGALAAIGQQNAIPAAGFALDATQAGVPAASFAAILIRLSVFMAGSPPGRPKRSWRRVYSAYSWSYTRRLASMGL